MWAKFHLFTCWQMQSACILPQITSASLAGPTGQELGTVVESHVQSDFLYGCMKLNFITHGYLAWRMMTSAHNYAVLQMHGNSFVVMGLLLLVLSCNPQFGAGKGREQHLLLFFLSAYFYAKSIIRSVIEVSLFICRYNTLPSRRTLKNSRLVSKKDDVHVCIMCLRAIMNYQVCLCFWSLKKNLNLSNSKLVLFGFLVLFLFEVNIRIKWDSIEKERTVFCFFF